MATEWAIALQTFGYLSLKELGQSMPVDQLAGRVEPSLKQPAGNTSEHN